MADNAPEIVKKSPPPAGPMGSDLVKKTLDALRFPLPSPPPEPPSPFEQTEKLRSSAPSLGEASLRHLGEYEAALLKETVRLPEDLGAIALAEKGRRSERPSLSQFALGRLVTAAGNEADASGARLPDTFIVESLRQAKSDPTVLAVLRRAERQGTELPHELLSPLVESSDAGLRTLAARLSAPRATASVDFASLGGAFSSIPPLEGTSEGFSMIASIMSSDLLGKKPEPPIDRFDMGFARRRIQALETLAARPDIEIPGGMDSLLRSLQPDYAAATKSRAFEYFDLYPSGSAGTGRNMGFQHHIDFVFRMAEAGRLEQPLEMLRSLLQKGSSINDRVLQFIETHPELHAGYSVEKIFADLETTKTSGFRHGEYAQARLTNLFQKGLQARNPQLAGTEIGPSIMNMLSHVRSEYPQTWNALADAGKLDELAVSMSEVISTERQRLVEQDRVIFGPGIKATSFFHEESRFSSAGHEDTTRRYGMTDMGSVRGSADPFVTADQKDIFLGRISQLAADPAAPATISIEAHGGPKHFYLTNGSIQQSSSENMHLPHAVSTLELAEAMVDGQIAAGRRTIDLSHLNVVHDACLQHDFIQGFREEVRTRAAHHGVTVEGYPLMVSVSQPSQPGYGVPFSTYRDELTRHLPTDGSPATVRHFLEADAGLRARQDAQLGIPAGEKFLVVPSDPALFSPAPFDNRRLETLFRGLLNSPEADGLIEADRSAGPKEWWNEVGSIYDRITAAAARTV